MIGKIIRHYRIEEKLGEGGMGVVYKATDTKLNRTVALKFLTERVQKDTQAKARFIQEAQAAAALNHAHICTIHSVEEVDESLFMVMEYVEGGTLREKLPFSKPEDAISTAAQIGEALEQAHAKGIVHRDVKADNIMLTADGKVKVMDFGLAKLKGALKLTRTSSTVGTLGYMAPEQIQGGEVDHRSDIFSTGVLLFEMLTGKLPFRGEHEAAMMYSILNEEPESIQTHLTDASPELHHILSRALEKEPEDRYQSMADMVSEMRRLLKQTSRISRTSIPAMPAATTPASSDMPSSTHTTPSVPAKSNRAVRYGILAVVVAAILVGVFFVTSGSSVELNPDMTLKVLDIPIPDIGYPSLSGDGNWITFTTNTPEGSSIYLMNTGGGEPRAIARESGVVLQHADLSFDASKIAYGVFPREGIPSIYLTSALGGGARFLADTAILPRWQPDGERIFFLRPTDVTPNARINIWSIGADGSGARIEAEDALGTDVSSLGRISHTLSPDGISIAFLRTFLPGGYQEVIVFNRETGEERQLTFDEANIDEVEWATNGQILFSSNRSGNTNIWMVSDDGGEPIQITKGSGPDLGVWITHDNSRILTYMRELVGDLWIGSLETGVAQPVTSDDRVRWNATLSPEGTRLAFRLISGDALKPLQAIYVSDRDGSNRQEVTTAGEKIVGGATWSPDGRRLAYSIRDPKDSTRTNYAYVVDVNRPGSETSLGAGSPFMWLDDELILLSQFSGTTIVSTRTGARESFFQDSTVGFPVKGSDYVFYRDHHAGKQGRWLVRVDHEGNPAGEPRKIMNIMSFDASPDRDHITFLDNDGLWRVDLPSGRKRKIRNTFSGLTPGTSFTVNPGTQEILYSVTRNRAKLVMIENPFK